MVRKIPVWRYRRMYTVALVDGIDYELVRPYRWNGSTGYAVATIEGRGVQMSRLILGVTNPKIVVDHINGNKLDNRRKNLRTCTQAENVANRKVSRNNRVGFKGVTYSKKRERYQAVIQHTKLGWFDSAEEAAKAYDKAAKRIFKSFAKLNFPTP